MRRETVYRGVEIAIIVAAAVVAVHGTHARPSGDLAWSRLATVYSLTTYGSFYIDPPEGEDPNPFGTVDRVMVRGQRVGNGVADGRMVSSKPPVLPLIMTAEYIVLEKVFGLELTDEADEALIVRIMTLTLVTSAYIAGLIFLMKTLRLFEVPALARVVTLGALAFGTQLWGYSTFLSNHVPAAGLLIIAIYYALGLCHGKLGPAPWRFVAFGLTAGLVCVSDVPATIFCVIAFACVLYKHPGKTLVWAAPAAAVPIAVQVGVMLVVTGSPFPVQVHKETYRFETSYWRHPMGIDGLSESHLTYLFHMTFGRFGAFSLYPILMVGLAGFVRAVLRRDTPFRVAILLGAFGFAMMTAYYALRTNNYGGESYGFRWYIVAMPVLLLMGVPILSRLRCPWQWTFVALMLAVSVYSAYECTTVGWVSSQEWTCRIFGPAM